jgi:hypothetical protein
MKGGPTGQVRVADHSATLVPEGPETEVRPDPPIASGAPITSGPEPPPRPPRGTAWNDHSLLLLAVVTVQIVLSLRLVWTNSASIEEATYLWAGHLELAHWLHGAAVPLFQTHLAGAPVIYPPIAALANSAGGLVGARLLSLAFMTAATVMLWAVTSRLFGARAAFFATALFAVLGPTQFLGALATSGAMALLLMTISAWCVVAAGQCHGVRDGAVRPGHRRAGRPGHRREIRRESRARPGRVRRGVRDRAGRGAPGGGRPALPGRRHVHHARAVGGR